MDLATYENRSLSWRLWAHTPPDATRIPLRHEKRPFLTLRRLLDQINAAPTLDMLRIPPSNRLEKLKGDLAGFWSLRINDQWRIVFRWQGQDASDVQVIDYH